MFTARLTVFVLIALYSQTVLGYFGEVSNPTRSVYVGAYESMCKIKCSIDECEYMDSVKCAAIPNSKYLNPGPDYFTRECNCCGVCQVVQGKGEKCGREYEMDRVCANGLNCDFNNEVCIN